MPYADPEKNAECKRRYKARKRAEAGLPPAAPRKPVMTREQRLAVRAQYRARNREVLIEKLRAWREANPEKIRAYSASEARKKSYTADNHRRRKGSVAGALHNRIGCQVYKVLRGGKGGQSWTDLLGFTPADLREHIERQFTRGMSWGRLLAGEIHIDHIVPLSSFTITGPDCQELRRAWALTNLRPLWARDNLSKGAKREVLI